MSQYSLRSIFRRLDRSLLIQYLLGKPATKHVITALRESEDLDGSFAAYDELPGAERDGIESDLRLVHDLSTEPGLKCIQQEIETRMRMGRDVSIPDSFANLEGIENKVLLVLLHEPGIVDVARLFHRADSFNERSWRRFEDLPCRPDLHLTEDMGSLIETGVRQLYAKEGRGQTVTAERYRRKDLHYVFAFADDYSIIRIEHDDKRTLRRRSARPTFELVYVYDPIQGTLDVFAPGDSKLKTAASRLFAEVVFGPGVDLVPQKPTYNVDLFRHRSTALPVSRGDGVAYARVRRLRLALTTYRTRRITFEVPSGGREKEIYDLMDAEMKRVSSDPRYEVTMAEVQLVMATDGEERRREEYRFVITAPNHCNLRNLPERIQEIAHRYLRNWGVSGHRAS